MKRKVAIFDVDGTIFRSSFLIELVNTLIEKGIFPEEARFEFEKEKTSWINRHGPYEHYIQAVVNVFAKYINGTAMQDIEGIAQEVVNHQENRTYRYTRDLLAKLKSESYYLLVISHSPKFILEEFCRKHGFDKCYGTLYATDDAGKFTGEVSQSELIFNKAKILERAVEKENLTLEGSIGVGDTESDISFLSLVEKPICFNPNKALYDEARKNNWLVVVERKDVIYEIPRMPTDSV
ncbi:MAG: hypothetical protein A3A26_03420 [Candidatus Zambryskibacteria bacterium RIFCSPLOWO2_01_FULL_47_14]|uniref:HAD-IB family hydrolase n=1 Tax=Candidatus Zambryskibacteria bacterium RIFCSPLOWO2_01_FULL_47_14 TaxID=1802763 RepID=A0A1G2UA98_9BACT|nr:MAG: hypothetical protein A3A26_03420 [Candidatus Zambryskibacteria bacterium RIFCSPLOWO2_01_FULL_47_14]